MPFPIIQCAFASPDLHLPVVEIRVDRQRLAKRLWRGIAEDGQEFGFELESPLQHGQTFWQNFSARYLISQIAEPILEVDLDMAASAAAAVGWAIGNQHLELSSEATRLLTPDDPAARKLLERISVSYRITSGIFRPGRFARQSGKATHPTGEFGVSHRH